MPATAANPPSTAWTETTIRALGVTTDVPTAGSILGLSRSHAYRLAHESRFPFPTLQVGARIRVPVAGILTALGYLP
jgi:hypothetical protein